MIPSRLLAPAETNALTQDPFFVCRTTVEGRTNHNQQTWLGYMLPTSSVASLLCLHSFHISKTLGSVMSKPILHVAIVGAGLGGLVAAIGIARAGHQVSILEKASVLGEVIVKSSLLRPYADLTVFVRSEREFRSPQTRPAS